ncbi:DUF6455 family protein [Primorskyibacter aestuariivivens]|uniref:DUF6455 family protein n=1 Tax=Primorskyibacter aestuariivivens TaxID=1888912 RepID=UPI002301071D|nr:DUF6455 family protein [Primorskyibacter aestuariivivens]MDA7429963.1 DUF6455 family protein [Primorskyibacter aestuariivivens]
MADVEKLRKHAALVDRMATARGLDLEEAALRGKISPDGIADAVLNCTGCTNPEDCAHWLETHSAPEQAGPSYCRNADLFEDLLRS